MNLKQIFDSFIKAFEVNSFRSREKIHFEGLRHRDTPHRACQSVNPCCRFIYKRIKFIIPAMYELFILLPIMRILC